MNELPARFSRLAAMLLVATTTLMALTAPATSGGTSPETDQPTASGEPPFDLADPKRIKAGEETFNATCASYCHGQNPTLFIDRTGLSEEYVYDTIRDGGKGATPMPPWGDVFTQEEIWELVAYIKSLGSW
ncbi:hypothetical protein W911_01395 [Hyphomicrobium nitrativorans NL23]|uniref:Cytochrome c domain-containing protein n=1 Tax=Hyphomicrobium nitrativorans NL23 TaxID=1029756 RepID=V5S9Q8_9HYPH|nr:cytochrome c [Hyphomicrobium nitrativorans]AHB47353.1 hypothetical protein W911_01395 [Hyphomicrobium nitrativorans NL23]